MAEPGEEAPVDQAVDDQHDQPKGDLDPSRQPGGQITLRELNLEVKHEHPQGTQTLPDGTFIATNATISALIAAAYPSEDRQYRNLPEWGRHITENLRARLVRSLDPSLEALLAELEGYLPPLPPQTDVLGFAVPL